MNRYAALLVLFIWIVIASSNPYSGLYSLDWFNNFNKIDPVTGSSTLIKSSVLDPSFYIGASGTTDIDTNRGILYILGYNYTAAEDRQPPMFLWGINITNGDVIINIHIPFFDSYSIIGDGDYLSVNSATGDVYATGMSEKTPGYHLMIKIDYDTKSFTKIAMFGNENFLDGSGVYDAANDIVWIEFMIKDVWVLQGVNATGGFSYADNTMAMETFNYDPVTKKVVGFGVTILNEDSLYRTLISFDGSTKEFVEIDSEQTLPPISNIIIGALDPIGRTVFSLFSWYNNTVSTSETYLASVNVDTGKVLNLPYLCNNTLKEFYYCPWAIAYYP